MQWVNSNQVLDNVKMALGAGGLFNLNGQSETVEAFAGSGAVGSRTLTLGSGVLATTAGVSLTSDTTLNLSITSLASFGQLNAATTLAAAGTLNVTSAYAFADGDTFDLFDGTISGTFATTALPTLGGGLSWNVANLYTDGSISVIPEPSTIVLLFLGLIGLCLRAPRFIR